MGIFPDGNFDMEISIPKNPFEDRISDDMDEGKSEKRKVPPQNRASGRWGIKRMRAAMKATRGRTTSGRMKRHAAALGARHLVPGPRCNRLFTVSLTFEGKKKKT